MTRSSLRIGLELTLAIVCGAAGATCRATGAEAPKPLGLEDQEVVRSAMFDADMILVDVAGHKAFILEPPLLEPPLLEPPKPKADGPKPWVWYAPTLLADRESDWQSPGTRHAWIFTRLLAAGVYVAGVDVGESWGSPAGRAVYDQFHERMVSRFGFSPRACLFGVSRGGLMAYNWAAERPDRVECIGGIYPLLNLRSFSGIDRITRAYGMSEEQLRAELARHNPVDRLRPLAAAGVEILHVHGDADTAVPLQSNSAELARRYEALGGHAEVIVIPGKGHEVVPELWQEPRLVEFLLKQAGQSVAGVPGAE
jgi:predicted esterase